jgi:hypothetical protein
MWLVYREGKNSCATVPYVFDGNSHCTETNELKIKNKDYSLL